MLWRSIRLVRIHGSLWSRSASRRCWCARDELLNVASEYVDIRVRTEGTIDPRDIGIYCWTRRGLNILETAVREAPVGTTPVPIIGEPEYLLLGLAAR